LLLSETQGGGTPRQSFTSMNLRPNHRWKLIRISEEEWAVIAPLLPPRKNRRLRSADSCKTYLEAMLWITVNDAAWRDLPAEYGKWANVYKCLREWSETGVLDKVAKALRQEMEVKCYQSQNATHERRAYRTISKIRKRVVLAGRGASMQKPKLEEQEDSKSA
jgi:transposase